MASAVVVGGAGRMGRLVREELLARVRVALKRHAPAPPPEPDASGVLAACGVTLDPDRHVVSVRDEPVELTNREFEVLRALMEHPGRVLTRVQLAQEALGYDYVGETNVVDVHIAHLRAKLDDRFVTGFVRLIRIALYGYKSLVEFLPGRAGRLIRFLISLLPRIPRGAASSSVSLS